MFPAVLLFLVTTDFDFGLSIPFLDSEDNHIKRRQLGRFTGNAFFASINSCKGYNKSRKDDIESAFYVILYLFNGLKLPWSHYSNANRSDSSWIRDFIKERQKRKYVDQIRAIVPQGLGPVFEEILHLKFSQEPPYDRILAAFNDSFNRFKVKENP